MPNYNLYFYPLSALDETEGTFNTILFGIIPTGTIFPDGDTPNYSADNSNVLSTPAELELTGSGSRITIFDNDPDLNDEDMVPPTLVSDPDGVTNSAVGQEFQLSYSYQLSGSDGSTINIQVIDFVNPGEPLGGNFSQDGITADAPLVPGVTYTVVGVFDGLGPETNPAYDSLVPCFCEGSLIETPDGLRPIEELKVSDLVVTADRGVQPIMWIGHSTVSREKLKALPELRPIEFMPGSLGADLPNAPLRVSPQHRMMVRSKIAQRIFDIDEVLIPAKKLLPCEGVNLCEDEEPVVYYHFRTPGHDIVFANGAPTETLFLGSQADKIFSSETLQEMKMIFGDDFQQVAARTIVKGKKQRSLVERHIRNNKELVNQS